MDGWMAGWMDGWMNGWMDWTLTNKHASSIQNTWDARWATWKGYERVALK